mmetsp:Transcript_22478/g.34120  ORF Transcript_22478/g.34120 Transcript_22478/m.34120 type:complete len:346 (-) Transcript_22478:276-1313(-)
MARTTCSYHGGYSDEFDEFDAFDPLTIQEEWHRERMEAQKWKQEHMRGDKRFSLRTGADGVPKVIEFQPVQDGSNQKYSCSLSDTDSTCATSVGSSFQCDPERREESRQQNGRGQSQFIQGSGPNRKLFTDFSQHRQKINAAPLSSHHRLSKSDHMKRDGQRIKRSISRCVSALQERLPGGAAHPSESCSRSYHLPKQVASRTRTLDPIEFDKRRNNNSNKYADHPTGNHERCSTVPARNAGERFKAKTMNHEKYMSELFDETHNSTNHTEAGLAQPPKMRSRSTGRPHMTTREKKSSNRENSKPERKRMESGYMNSLFNSTGPAIGIIQNDRSTSPRVPLHRRY